MQTLFNQENLQEDIYKDILEHSKKGYPYEIGGIIVEINGQIVCQEVQNKYTDHKALDYFEIDSRDILEMESKGEILAIYHSHPMTLHEPSLADYHACFHSDYPMIIINPLTEKYSYTTPEIAHKIIQENSQENAQGDILGQDFVWGVNDCLGLVTKVYDQHLGIKLPYFERGILMEWDENSQWDKFNDHFAEAGFDKFPVPRGKPYLLNNYDVFLMNVAGKFTNPNHCAVLINSQTMEFWHHLLDRKSEKGIYKGYWENCTLSVLRHPRVEVRSSIYAY